MDFSTAQLVAISCIFVWSGFVRAGLGFGGAALALPLLLMVANQPLFFLPIIALHLLIFSSLTMGKGFKNVDGAFLKESLSWMIIPKLAGVIGLLSLPNQWMVWIIYVITAGYAFTWIIKWEIRSQSPWADRLLFIIGGYFSGVSLIGAPLIVAVAVRKIPLESYRDTLFVLWFILVTIKICAFAIAGVDLQWQWSLMLLLPTAVGHLLGLRFHHFMLKHDAQIVRQWLGIGLLAIVVIALWQ
ncbi:sulfite exporter TauE/SafE family protein [Oceanospirillaceae bacterium]|nr:sulfite exporter TauE/SafE family protein [Oceanospirillaceae bacterium]